MIGPNAHHKYHLYAQPTDMRKSFDGLCGLDGEVYIFMNRRRDMIKLLVWDRTGFVIYCKRLEQGTFEKPIREDNSGGIQLSWEELMLILEGIALDSVQRRKRYALAGS